MKNRMYILISFSFVAHCYSIDTVKSTTYANTAIINSTLQSNITGTTNICDNKSHNIRTVWDTNDNKLYVANIQEGSTDPSCTIPTITQMDLSDYAQANQANALISNLKVFGRETLGK